jgi:ParB-like chromosome segregation protein Spo0J
MRAKPTTETPLEIVYRNPADLQRDPHNARTHSDAQVREIAGAIRRFGYTAPILIDEELRVRCGEGRWLAVQHLGLEQVPTIMRSGLTERQWRALALADNRIAMNSGWDAERLRATLDELRSEDEAEVEGLGFSKAELDELFGEGSIDPIKVQEIATTDVADRFWITIRGDLQHQAEALRRLQEATRDLPGVEVELGTIGIDL